MRIAQVAPLWGERSAETLWRNGTDRVLPHRRTGSARSRRDPVRERRFGHYRSPRSDLRSSPAIEYRDLQPRCTHDDADGAGAGKTGDFDIIHSHLDFMGFLSRGGIRPQR